MDAALRWESLAQPVTMASDDLLEGLLRSVSGVRRGSPGTESGVGKGTTKALEDARGQLNSRG